jgi:hypothetical protein
MATTISQITTAITTKLATINGLRVYDYTPDTVYPPVAYPSITNIDYHRAMAGGMIIYSFTISVVVGRVNERVAQEALDGYASYSGAGSIRAALETDPTLGGVVDTLIVPSSASISSTTIGEQDFLTLDFQLEVYAR